MKFIPYTLFAIAVIFASLSSTGSDKQKKLWKCMASVSTSKTMYHMAEIIQAETKEEARQKWNSFLKNDPDLIKGTLMKGAYGIFTFNPSTDILK